MGDFIFYAASQAYYCEMRKAFPRKGVQEYGNLFHTYNIPVTWLTNSMGAELGKDIFTQFHEDFGDEVILWCRPHSSNTSGMRDYALNMKEGEIRKFILAEQKGVKKHLPFAQVDHIGYFYRTIPAVRAMRSLGIKSCYGHCWELVETDGVTDNGVPWGFYYMDVSKSWRKPSQKHYDISKNQVGIIANEWLQHDLNKSWNYYGSCSVFSFDPNDVERAKICDGRSIDYWKSAFREYYRNRAWNEFIPFVFHQEAHEQESTPGGWEVCSPETVKNTYAMTDEFLSYITSHEFGDMHIMTLPQAIEHFRSNFTITNPTYMLYKDIPIDMPIWNKRKKNVWEIYHEAKLAEEEDGDTLDPIEDYKKFHYLGFPYGWQGMLYQEKEPFPESFLYCDAEVQLFFHRGTESPIKIWNYVMNIDSDPKNLYFNENLFKEPHFPQIRTHPSDYNP